MQLESSDLAISEDHDDSESYHRLELLIASDPGDPRRVMPAISAHHRRILDVGCGAGQILIASDLASNVLAVGADIDHSALLLGDKLSSNIQFVCASGEGLPFENATFDLVICRIALPYMHIHRALSEMWRVLSTGGDLWLVLHPFSMIRRELIASLTRLKLKSIVYQLYVVTNGLALHLLGGQFKFPFKGGSYESFQTVKGIQSVLRSVGFNQIKIDRSKFFVVTAKKAPTSE